MQNHKIKPQWIGLLGLVGLLSTGKALSQSVSPIEVPGFLKMEVWNNLSASDNALDNTLLADPRYPASPTSIFWASGFNSRTVYPDDSHDGYGGKISGLIIPPETGAYRFFIYSDDSSRLFLSTDDKPANATQIAEETGCCNIFTEPDSPRTSEPISLTAGKKYYIEGVWKEGGGGDYMQVAWRKEGSTTPAASLTPISPAYLASMVPASGSVTISQQPGNLSVARNDRSSLTVVYKTTNSPVLVQWQRNGVPVVGATGSTLPLGPVQESDNGAKYRAVISTPGAVATSDEAVVTVTPDVTLPKVTGVVASDTFDTVTVDFSEAINAASAGAKANYTLDGGLSVTAATVESPTRVRLTTTRQAQGAAYNLTLNNIEDTAVNKVAANTKVPFTAFAPIKGGLKLEVYLNIPGSAVQSLIDDPRFLTAPDRTGYTRSFTSRDVITDSSTENYGGRLFGWIVPTETADYNFFIRSDDASQLFLSTDDKRENLRMIAEETGCCGAFEDPAADPAPTETSVPVSLVAGKRYFIEALWKEGGGGDYCDVAWRKVGDATVSRTLGYIPGTVLESIASPNTFTPPTVVFASPGPGSSFDPGVPVVLTVAPVAAGGKSITRVEFFEGTRKVGEATAEPWSVTLVGLSEDQHSFTARATDNGGLTQTSAPLAVTVGGLVKKLALIAIDDKTTWSYDRSGEDRGTAWREPGFNDGSWPKGKALIADETTTTVEPIRTPISRFNEAGTYVQTFYFRTHFQFNEPITAAVKLALRHAVDDGAVFYLNGKEIHRFGIGADATVDSTTSFNGHENAWEGPYDILHTFLVPGDNVLAVEVHQSGGSSSDMVFGAELTATVPALPRVVTLLAVNDTTEWRYDRSGNDLGTSWQDLAFNDGSWPKGKALIADETTTTVEPIRTPISRFNDAGTYIQTFYFRGRFNYDGWTKDGVKLRLRHAVDDGAVFYLNGKEVHRFGIGADVAVDATTSFNGHENAWEGPYDIDPSLLVIGDNLLAVQVHQSGGSSSDMVFGAELIVTIPPDLGGGGPGPAPVFGATTLAGDKVVFSWTGGGVLQTSTRPDGGWTDVAGASSPYTVSPTDPARFYRVRK